MYNVETDATVKLGNQAIAVTPFDGKTFWTGGYSCSGDRLGLESGLVIPDGDFPIIYTLQYSRVHQ